MAWAEFRLAGQESFVSAALGKFNAIGGQAAGQGLVEMLEAKPPIQIYLALRAWASQRKRFAGLGTDRAEDLRARVVRHALALADLYRVDEG